MILFIVVVPSQKSPPMNCKTVSNSSELKLLQFNFSSKSSITSKKSVLNSSQCVNDYYLFERSRNTLSSFSNRILCACYCRTYNFLILLSMAVSKRQNEGTALGYKYKITGSASYANGTTKIIEQGMNFNMSMKILFTLVNSQPVNQNLALVL